jgi:hypothetical protein
MGDAKNFPSGLKIHELFIFMNIFLTQLTEISKNNNRNYEKDVFYSCSNCPASVIYRV